MDAKCDVIQATIPTRFVKEHKSKLMERQTYIIQNFKVLPNNSSFKINTHPYKLIFCDGSDVDVTPFPDIPLNYYNFFSFSNIVAGNFSHNVSADVIGVVHEITERNTSATHKTPKVAFTMKDLSGIFVDCTLWNEFANKFFDYYDNKKDVGAVIVLLKYAIIKPSDANYPVTVSSYWNGTKLLINEGKNVEIEKFKNSLPARLPLLMTNFKSKSKNGLRILIHNKEKQSSSNTTNVVYKEVFQAIRQ